jgi:hypothetical protein
VGRQVLRTSGTILRVGTGRGPVAAVARRAVPLLAGAVPALRRRAAGVLSALDVSYPAPPGTHPSAGRRVPDLPLVAGPAGSRLAEALRAGRFVLVRPSGDPDPGGDPPPCVGEVDPAERVVVQRADGRPGTLLVRPDGYLADALPR